MLSGGWFGRGPGEGVYKRILPDAHTDFVFAVAGEEFGMVACLALIAFFGFIVMRGLWLASRNLRPVQPLRRGGADDHVRRAELDQHGGQPARDPGQGHDAAVHFLRRLARRSRSAIGMGFLVALTRRNLNLAAAQLLDRA